MKKAIWIVVALIAVVLLLLYLTGDAQTASVNLIWTAVGDDDNIGTAAHYDLRRSTDSLQLLNSWNSCEGGIITLIPSISGTTENWTINNLPTNTKIFFSVKAIDEAGNIGDIGNILGITTPDFDKPAPILDLRPQL